MLLCMITHGICWLMLVMGLMLTRASYIGVSTTCVWVAECPLVGGKSGDSPLMMGLSKGSCWGRGATDSSVLPWLSWSTWKESSALMETRDISFIYWALALPQAYFWLIWYVIRQSHSPVVALLIVLDESLESIQLLAKQREANPQSEERSRQF